MIPSVRKLVEMVSRPDMRVMEVGVWNGETTITYLDIIKKNNGKMYAIDTFEGAPTVDGEHAYQPERKQKTYEEFLNRTQAYSDIVVTMPLNSSKACKLFQLGFLDLCFIDADHRYSQISQDIKNYLPLVKKGGIFSGHDFDCHYSQAPPHTPKDLELDTYKNIHLGVSKAVCENLTEINLLEDRVWYVRV